VNILEHQWLYLDFFSKFIKLENMIFDFLKKKRDSWCHVYQVSTHVGHVWLPGLDLARISPAIFGMFGCMC
jgi:hypothetical protein